MKKISIKYLQEEIKKYIFHYIKITLTDDSLCLFFIYCYRWMEKKIVLLWFLTKVPCFKTTFYPS